MLHKHLAANRCAFTLAASSRRGRDARGSAVGHRARGDVALHDIVPLPLRLQPALDASGPTLVELSVGVLTRALIYLLAEVQQLGLALVGRAIGLLASRRLRLRRLPQPATLGRAQLQPAAPRLCLPRLVHEGIVQRERVHALVHLLEIGEARDVRLEQKVVREADEEQTLEGLEDERCMRRAEQRVDLGPPLAGGGASEEEELSLHTRCVELPRREQLGQRAVGVHGFQLDYQLVIDIICWRCRLPLAEPNLKLRAVATEYEELRGEHLTPLLEAKDAEQVARRGPLGAVPLKMLRLGRLEKGCAPPLEAHLLLLRHLLGEGADARCIEEAIEARQVHLGVGTRLAIPDRILDHLLGHHVAEHGLVEAAVARWAAHKGVEGGVALLPHVDDCVHGHLQAHLREDATQDVDLLAVRVCDACGLVRAHRAAVELGVDIEEALEVGGCARVAQQAVRRRL